MQNFWSRPLVDVDLSHQIKYSAALYKNSLNKRFLGKDSTEQGTILRPSNLGKPAVDLFGMRFFSDLYKQDEQVDARLNHLFHMGDTWECDGLLYLVQRGFEIIEVQPKINWRNTIKGTADVVVCSNDVHYVVEFKTANANYFKSSWDMTLAHYKLPAHLADKEIIARLPLVLKSIEQTALLNNRRGHITQMSLYSDALHMPPMMLMLNKDNAEVVEGYITVDERDAALHRVEQIVDAWNQVEHWEDIFQYIKPPPVRREYKNKKWTGRYMPHMSMYNSPIMDKVYELLPDDDGKLIVVDYCYPEQWIHLKPPLN